MPASLIKSYSDIVAPKNRSNVLLRKKLASGIRQFRKKQASLPVGKGVSARKVIHSRITKEVNRAHARRRIMDNAIKKHASKSFVTSTPHYPHAHTTIHVGAQINKKRARFAAQKNKSSTASASPSRKVRSKSKASLLGTFSHMASASNPKRKRMLKRNAALMKTVSRFVSPGK